MAFEIFFKVLFVDTDNGKADNMPMENQEFTEPCNSMLATCRKS